MRRQRGVIGGPYTFAQAQSLCALGSAIIYAGYKSKQPMVAYDQGNLQGAYNHGIRVFYEWGWLPDNLLTD